MRLTTGRQRCKSSRPRQLHPDIGHVGLPGQHPERNILLRSSSRYHMRFVLVDNLIYEGPHTAPKYDLQPHLGLLSLAAVVRANGHEPEIYDPKLDLLNGHLQLESSLYEKFALRILEQHPDVVGFTALGCNFNCVVKVADH